MNTSDFHCFAIFLFFSTHVPLKSNQNNKYGNSIDDASHNNHKNLPQHPKWYKIIMATQIKRRAEREGQRGGEYKKWET